MSPVTRCATSPAESASAPLTLASGPARRQRLIAQKVDVATYCKEVLRRGEASAPERELVDCLVALPIDQRYGPREMQVVLDLTGAVGPACPR